MGAKLDWQKEMSYMGELQKFYFACEKDFTVFTTRIEVLPKNKKSVFFSEQIQVKITYDNSNCKVDILWEDAGFDDYRDMQLYGYYSPSFVPMKYYPRNKYLEINSSDSNKIVRVYVKE